MNDIPAKVDTGAYCSAVHADGIHLDKSGTLCFRLLGSHPICGSMATDMTASHYKEVWIYNSFGQEEKRYEVRLKIKLGPKVFVTPLTLADRSKKIYPILLGRKLLNHRFLVDPSKSSLNRIDLKKKFGINFPIDEEDDENCNS
jgi:hypothetical protein